MPLVAGSALATTAFGSDDNTQWKARGTVALSIYSTGWLPANPNEWQFPYANPVVSPWASPMGQAAFGERKNGGTEWYAWASQKFTNSSPNTATSLLRESVAKGRRYCNFLVTFRLKSGHPMPTQPLKLLIRRYIKHTTSLKLSGIGTSSNDSQSGAAMMVDNQAFFDGLGTAGANETTRGWEVQRARYNGDVVNTTTNKSWSKKTGYVLNRWQYVNGGPSSDAQEYSVLPTSFHAEGGVDSQGRQKYVAEVIDYAVLKLRDYTRFTRAKGKIEVDTRIETKVRVSIK